MLPKGQANLRRIKSRATATQLCLKVLTSPSENPSVGIKTRHQRDNSPFWKLSAQPAPSAPTPQTAPTSPAPSAPATAHPQAPVYSPRKSRPHGPRAACTRRLQRWRTDLAPPRAPSQCPGTKTLAIGSPCAGCCGCTRSRTARIAGC